MDKPSHTWKGRGFRLLLAAIAVGAMVGASGLYNPVVASDHDDGETNIKSRNSALTDLYVFREDWHSGNAADANNLIFILNTNPRSVPRQHYFFNTNAFYNFHVSRRGTDRNAAVSGVEDMRFEFSFATPTNNQQSVRLQVHRFAGGNIQATQTFANAGVTTPTPPLLPPQAPVVNTVVTGDAGGNLAFFAGTREDPFFFDVEEFFKVRAALAGSPGPTTIRPNAFQPPNLAEDFASGYNVSSIVLRVPLAFVRATNDTVFDVWETISIPTTVAQFQ